MNSPQIPKYYQISREIMGRIQRGEIATGAPVPSENEIIARYDVSNTTARKALHELVTGGWVERIKGKGTFVRDYTVDRSINRLFGFTKNMLEAGRKPSTRLLGFRRQPGSHSRTINGRSYTLEGPYCQIERVRFADGIPMMKEIRYISEKFCPEIFKQDLERSLFHTYEQKYGLTLVEFNQMLSAIILDDEWFETFEVEKAIPAFRVEGVTFCGKDQILELEDAVYRGDIYRFSAKAVP